MINAVILAGGEGRRMGGQDKGLQPLSGRPLVAWVLAALRQQSQALDQIVISANRNEADYARCGCPVIHDSQPGFRGPMAGIEAALHHSRANYLLVVPCDTPFLPLDLVARLFTALEKNPNAQAAEACGSDGQRHHAICLMRHNVLASLSQHLAQQQYRLGFWLQSLHVIPVQFPNASFANLNDPHALGRMEQELQKNSATNSPSSSLTHFDASGKAQMVDVGDKPESKRIAIARGEIHMQAATLALIAEGSAQKGDVLGVARIAGIMGAKKTADVIPLCHPLPLSQIQIAFELDPPQNRVICTATTATTGRTGVEMEALTAVSIALLTIYDMCKAVDRGMQMTNIQLLEKMGGKSGHWQAQP